MDAPGADYSDVVNQAIVDYPRTIVSSFAPQSKKQYVQSQIDDAVRQKQQDIMSNVGLPKGTIQTVPTYGQFQQGQPGTGTALIGPGQKAGVMSVLFEPEEVKLFASITSADEIVVSSREVLVSNAQDCLNSLDCCASYELEKPIAAIVTNKVGRIRFISFIVSTC